ncbi:MAG: T9SS type A sorting domain-containing protein [Chitinophagales bacterium]|nr:T9SS type A sorting domain-containing protein [Chitinophagales bacterium]
MKKAILILFLFNALIFSSLNAQVAPSIEWQKSLGGSLGETAQSIIQTSDGGNIIAGYSWSHDGDIIDNKGMSDCWILKFDAAGNLEWQKSFGGTLNDVAYSIQQLSDGGYVVAGYTKSSDGDFTFNHGSTDFCVLRLDAQGNLLWRKSLGGSEEDWGFSIKECFDGGFIFVGYSKSNDGDLWKNNGDWDYWVVKLDVAGVIEWQRSFGGDKSDEAYAVVQTNNGDFVIAGGTHSANSDVTGNHGNSDVWLVKLDAYGTLLWQKCFGGSGDDFAYAIENTIDGGLIVVGESASNDGNATNNNGSSDYWILKLDVNGNLLWQKSYGGSDYEMATSVDQTTDGGFIVAGDSYSSDGDATLNHGLKDDWILKLDATGNLQWQKSLGGSYLDHANAVVQNTDGSYLIAGSSFSNDGDVTGNHPNSLGNTEDYWIVKLSADVSGIETPATNFISVYPNPAQDYLIINLGIETNATTIEVDDVNGKEIFIPQKFTNFTAQLNTSALAAGFYTIEIINNKSGERVFKKFVKGK